MKYYDSESVEEMATALSALSVQVNAIYTGDGQRLVEDAANCLEGRAGDALQTSMTGLFKDLYSINSGLAKLEQQLEQLAKKLHETDEQTRGLIQNK